jgi:hypothetical protein
LSELDMEIEYLEMKLQLSELKVIRQKRLADDNSASKLSAKPKRNEDWEAFTRQWLDIATMPMFSTVPDTNDQVYMEAASTWSEENEKILFEQKNVDFMSTFKVDNHPTSDCDQFVVTSSVDDGDSSPAEPVEAGELIEAAFVGTDTVRVR